MPEVILNNDTVRLVFHRDDGIVHHTMKKGLTGTLFRETLSRGAGLMEQSDASKWLSDDRAHVVLPPEDEEWARSQWFPRVRAAGWRYWAIVKPERAIGTLNMVRFAEMYAKLGIGATITKELDEALTWLREQD